MRLIVIYNTSAGKKQRRIRAKIAKFFRRKRVHFDLFDYNQCDWEQVRQLCAGNAARVVVVGGDGTLRRVIEFLWKHQLLKCPVAFVPIGSGNVVAYSLRLPLAMRDAFERSITGTPRPLDLGVVNDEHVFFIAAVVGTLATISTVPERSLKKRFGFFAYLLHLPALFVHDYMKEAFDVRMKSDGDVRTVRTHSVFFVNHLNVAALQPRRGVLPDDGLLDIFTLHNTHYLGLARALLGFYWEKGSSSVLQHFKTSSVECSFTNLRGHLNLDGDRCEYTRFPLTFKVLPGAVSFIV